MYPLIDGIQATAAFSDASGPLGCDRTLVMGILNVTPDSFSDGGDFLQTERAIQRGLDLAAAGADIIDLGGESTRPGAVPVPEDAEMTRVLPVVTELARAGLYVSIDTMHASVAEAAVLAGARLVNDVSGGLSDPSMARWIATAGVPYVAMHWRGPSLSMQARAHYESVVTDVVDALRQRVDALVDAGVNAEQIILDPGLGFAKTAAHNWAILANLDRLHALGRPVLIGASRKAFLGELTTDDPDAPMSRTHRDYATSAVSALAAAAGAYCVRVHDVAASVAAVRVAARWHGILP